MIAEFLGPPKEKVKWSEDECRRLVDADKLAGHLSVGRIQIPGQGREWGDDKDLQW
jgi:hypothetical protein